MSIAVLVLNAAYVALLASTLTRTLTWLRVMLILASVAFVVFGILEDIRAMIMWNIAIGCMHLFHVVRDYRQQKSVSLTSEERSDRDQFFPGLNDFDFHLLWCMSSEARFDDDLLIHAGELPEMVSLVLDGTAIVEDAHGEILRGLRRGALIGEMSFVSGQPAEVEVRARGGVLVRQWDHRQLASLDQLHPASARAFRELLSRDLAAKVRI